MNNLSPSDFAGLEYSHKQRTDERRWAELDGEEREIPLQGLYLYVRNLLLLLSASVSIGVAAYFWS
jgi:hypothetical protein